MKNRKKLKQITSCVLVSVVALIIGYTILIPNEKTDGKNSPLAVYLQDGQTYTKSIIKNFDEILVTHIYDHIDCGSAVENAKWTWNNGTLSATGINAHTTCKLYFNEIPAGPFTISTITVDGTQVSSVPTTMNYHVQPTCTGIEKGKVKWNYVNWSLDVSATKAKGQTCSLAFTTITSSNLASKFTGSAAAGKYLSTYIKSLLGNGTSVNVGESGNTLQNLGTAEGTEISNGTTNYYHDIGIRYIGPNPNNYIKFNNELWRIIGIFREAKTSALTANDTYYTKIIRNESIGGYAYNGVSSNGGWWSKSDGSVSTLNYLLNHYYMGADSNNYNGTSDTTNCKIYSTTSRPNCDYTVIGIQPGWRDMIINTTWYTAAGVSSSDANSSFSGERGSTAGAAGGDLSYNAKVGLMYPSDYLYSGSEVNLRWLLQDGGEWALSPNSWDAYNAWYVRGGGNISNDSAYGGFAVRPTVYLSSEVYITGGTGTMLDPYTIAM